MNCTLIHGDCLEKMREMEDNSISAVITDPPYELGFMGKAWDSTGIANSVEMWKECLRVLKPGGHLLSFGGTRTYHRMASAIEDAGFEVRDMIEWVYGSGMSKGNVWNEGKKRTSERLNKENDLMVANGYEGWGNVGMKPAHEPIAFCRKPIEKGSTVAENCLKWGTGGTNIEESRVEATGDVSGWSKTGSKAGENTCMSGANYEREAKPDASKRFPANLIHDNSEEVRECFPETGNSARPNIVGKKYDSILNATVYGKYNPIGHNSLHNDSGNASRFFKSIIYNAKASKSDRGKGNTHATVKPTALMEYLIKMVTPKDGTILDPFMGSGTTGVACKNLNRNFIGIELNEDYYKIAQERINNVPAKLT